jgi:hypothetical protein
MTTNKTLKIIAAATIVLGATIAGAEARKVSYTINGQRFTYDTNAPDQVESARKRIDAANAADAAKAKADAERAGNPLVATFGSQLQRDAAQAKARLDQVLAEEAQNDATLKRQRAAREEQRRKRTGEETAQAAPAKEAAETAAAEPAPTTPAPDPVPAAATPAPAAPAPVPIAEPIVQDQGSQAPIKSVSFDFASGIKTTIMTDGSIHEEPFDSSTLAKLEAAPGSAGSLNAFVNQLRRAVSVETTGSTVSNAAPSPEPGLR